MGQYRIYLPEDLDIEVRKYAKKHRLKEPRDAVSALVQQALEAQRLDAMSAQLGRLERFSNGLLEVADLVAADVGYMAGIVRAGSRNSAPTDQAGATREAQVKRRVEAIMRRARDGDLDLDEELEEAAGGV